MATKAKTNSKKSQKPAKKTTKATAPKRKKMKVMSIREIAAECGEQLRDQHAFYQQCREKFEDDPKMLRMIDRLVMSDKDCKEVIDGAIVYMINEVEEKGEFTIPGMVKVFARYRKAMPKRMGRNPATGEEMKLPAKKASYKAAARPMKGAKDAIEKFAKKNPAK